MPTRRLALGLFVIGILLAQSGGQIVGTVADASGGLVPGAAVTAINSLTGREFNASTDAAGRFSFPTLPVGDYRIRVAKDGFQPFRSEMFHLDADQSRQISATLAVGTSKQSV